MQYDIGIIGGGIIGLASAFQILEKNPKRKLCVLEKEQQLAMHQTQHNSGVIHSGIYYRPGSLKAENCKRGYQMLINFCQKENIAYELCGKIIVATKKKELPTLDFLFNRGKQNGLKDLKKLSSEAIKEYEPYVNGFQGIFVPQTGITNFKSIAEKYAEKIKEKGGDIFTGEKVINIIEKTDKCEIITDNKTYQAKLIINCGGLYSDKIAAMTQGKINLKIIPFRGEYYIIKKEKSYLIKNLVYPVPNPNFPFLGVHFTRMIDNKIKAGPNAVIAYQREGYKKTDINISELLETISWLGFQKIILKYWQTGIGEMYRSYSKHAFTRALKKFLPDIEQEDLVTKSAGVRAQACDIQGNLLDDFCIMKKKRVINICNAPSPGATSSLSIGNYIIEKI